MLKKGQTWAPWLIPVISVLKTLRQKNLGYLVSRKQQKLSALGAFQILYFQIRAAQLISICLLIDRNS